MGLKMFKLYEVQILFKTERDRIDGLMQYRSYRKIVADIQAAREMGTYPVIVDGKEIEVTFPVAEIDTIHAAYHSEAK